MKFDVIVGNPPYQKQVGPNKSEPLWNKFVEKAFEHLKEGGYLSLVHPSGWRNISGKFENAKKLLLSKNIQYLEMHNENDGVKIFGVRTTYDWYLIKNIECKNNKTKIKSQNGNIKKVNLNKLPFIPNGMFSEIEKLIAKNGEERCEVINDSSYHTQRLNLINKEKTSIFKYPCVYTTEGNGTINCWYSNTNENGHFGIPKVFWSNGAATSTHIDNNGEYGLTQFAYAIVDKKKNLKNIKKAMETKKFIEIMKYSTMGLIHKYYYKSIATFKKDFWKYFVDENGKEI
jgi:hypothetical protein